MFWRIACNPDLPHNDCIIFDWSSAASPRWKTMGSNIRIFNSICDRLNKVCPSLILYMAFCYKKMRNIGSKRLWRMVWWFDILRRSWIVFTWFLKTQSSLIYWKSIYFKINSWNDFVSMLNYFYPAINTWLS